MFLLDILVFLMFLFHSYSCNKLYIYVGLHVHRMSKCLGGITWLKHAHAQSQFWAVKTDL